MLAMPAMALVACTATGPAIGSDSEGESGSDSEGESDDESDSGSELDPDTEDESDSDEGMMPEPDLPPEPTFCNLEDCPVGSACVDDECVEIEQPSSCAAPVLVALPQPSPNGRVVALELVDLQADGDVEIITWIDDVGVGVLDELQWTTSEYLWDTDFPTIAAIHADDDDLLDVVFNGGNNKVRIGFGDGAGSFSISQEYFGISMLRSIAFTPDERRAFGVEPEVPDDHAAYLSFDAYGHPTVVEFPAPIAELFPAQLDGVASEDVVYTDRCEAYAARIDADGDLHAQQVLLDYQPLDPYQSLGHCRWASADFDGDGRDELIARELLHYGWDFPQSMLLTVLPNISEADVGVPSFDTPRHTKIPEVHGATIAGDFDGDGDDELLLTLGGVDGGGTLVWASDEQLIGCMADLPSLPSEIHDFRTGDIDGDGDDELVMFRENGELRVLDFQ
jgi:hypothetical protein